MTKSQRTLANIAAEVKPLIPTGVRRVSCFVGFGHIELLLGDMILVTLAIHPSKLMLAAKIPKPFAANLRQGPGRWTVEDGEQYVAWLLDGLASQHHANRYAISGVVDLIHNILNTHIVPRLKPSQEHILTTQTWPDN